MTLEPLVAPIIDDETQHKDDPPRRFNLAPLERNDASAEQRPHMVRSDYVEQNWLPYLGPNAFVFARKVDGILATEKAGAIDLIKWSEGFGIAQGDLVHAANRLVRFGLAAWGDRVPLVYYLLRRWPSVPSAIRTPMHRQALLALPDEVDEHDR